MEVMNPRIRSLLRQAQKTARVGKRAAAQQLYEEILEESPETVEAWLGLARVSSDVQVQRRAYEKVLELDPHNKTAREQLERPLDGETAQQALAPTAKGRLPRPELEEPTPDPFDTRQWLEEATRRRPFDGDDGAGPRQTDSPDKQPSTTPEAPQDVVTTPVVEQDESDDDEEALYCYRHPKRETGLRCYTCGQPICTRCAQHTPVGYRCPKCIREAQDVFFEAGILEYVLGTVVALVLGLIAGYIAPRIGFFVIFIGPAAGTLIGRVAFRVARRRRGRYLPHLVAAMVALGGFLPVGLPLLLGMLVGGVSLGRLGFGLLWPAIYVFLATGAAYYQMK
ncbi:MAG TPA: hypothetical protein VK879_09550 [Candidatus Sulfomarinibacteraceae bacterium]|nr:hypothetical protein [Candidatus Sulfomarinibacteraceae bacterium]